MDTNYNNFQMELFPNSPFLFSLDPSLSLEEPFTNEKVIFIKDTRVDITKHPYPNLPLPFNLIRIISKDDNAITLHP